MPASAYLPSVRAVAIQSVHHRTVRVQCCAASTSSGSGGSRCDGYQVSTVVEDVAVVDGARRGVPVVVGTEPDARTITEPGPAVREEGRVLVAADLSDPGERASA